MEVVRFCCLYNCVNATVIRQLQFTQTTIQSTISITHTVPDTLKHYRLNLRVEGYEGKLYPANEQFDLN